MRMLIFCAVCLLTAVASAQPKLLVVLVHQAVEHDAIVGRVPSQLAWMVWERGDHEPYRLSTGQRIRWSDSARLDLQIVSGADTAVARHQLLVRVRASPEVLAHTLASRLQHSGKSGVYLSTPQSSSPTAFGLLVASSEAATPVHVFPSLEAMRLGFFNLKADWALLELKRWDYRALELLLAEGVEVWVVVVPSPDELRFSQTRLSAVVRFAARESNGFLTSPSTRWSGVIREIDLAPTLYYALVRQRGDGWAGSPAFETRQSDWHQFWNGWLVRAILRGTFGVAGAGVCGNPLAQSAEWIQANEKLAPALCIVLLALWLFWLGTGWVLWWVGWLHGVVRRVFVAGLAAFLMTPAVGVAYAYAPFAFWTGDFRADAATVVGWLVACWVGLSLIAAGVVRWAQTPWLCAAAIVSLTVISVDLLIAGGYGANRSLFSGGINSARSFGVAEGFWAFVLGTGLLAPASWLESRGQPRFGTRGQLAIGMTYGVLLMLCGLPLLGTALDAWLVMTLAWGLGMGIFTGLLPLRSDLYLLVRAAGMFAVVGVLLTGLAVGVDALQPWQRQAGWTRDWWEILGWRFAPLEWLSVGLGGVLVASAIREPLQRMRERALVLRAALLVGLLCAGVALLLGKVIASVVILAMGQMFLLEYHLGGKDWGYPYDGVVH